MAYPMYPRLQVRSGNVIDLEGRLYEVLKLVHTHGHGRQLGNVQVCLRSYLQNVSTRSLHVCGLRFNSGLRCILSLGRNTKLACRWSCVTCTPRLSYMRGGGLQTW